MVSYEEHILKILEQNVSILMCVVKQELCVRGELANYSEEEMTKICLTRMGLLKKDEKTIEDEIEDF